MSLHLMGGTPIKLTVLLHTRFLLARFLFPSSAYTQIPKQNSGLGTVSMIISPRHPPLQNKFAPSWEGVLPGKKKVILLLIRWAFFSAVHQSQVCYGNSRQRDKRVRVPFLEWDMRPCKSRLRVLSFLFFLSTYGSLDPLERCPSFCLLAFSLSRNAC